MTETKEHPTPKLRFVQRQVAVPINDGREGIIRELRILQQEWEIVTLERRHGELMPTEFRFEWRDVPLEVDA